MNETTKRVLEQRRDALASLQKHPAYQEWKAEVERRKERDLKDLVARCLKLGQPVDQREFDEVRGFWEGAMWAVSLPEKAEDTLQKALRKLAQREVTDPLA